MEQTIAQFLQQIKLSQYVQIFKKYGVSYASDLLFLTPQDWKNLDKILPFHRTKIIHAAANYAQKNSEKSKIVQTQERQNGIHKYTFKANGPYHGNNKAQHLLTFDPQGYGTASSNDCFMQFTFDTPQTIYGVIIGNNVGVSGGWNGTHLQGVQIQSKTLTSNYETVHTIQGMPSAQKTAYLAKIQRKDVKSIKFTKGSSYFSTSFVHFV